MLRCREVVPRIASAIVRTLRGSGGLEVEERLRDNAELSAASGLVAALSATDGKADSAALAASALAQLRTSRAVTRVRGEDPALLALVEPVIRRYENVDAAQDAKVRSRLDPLAEGTEAWEQDYGRLASGGK